MLIVLIITLLKMKYYYLHTGKNYFILEQVKDSKFEPINMDKGNIFAYRTNIKTKFAITKLLLSYCNRQTDGQALAYTEPLYVCEKYEAAMRFLWCCCRRCCSCRQPAAMDHNPQHYIRLLGC